MFCVAVHFTVEPQFAEAFGQRVSKQAAESLANEVDCSVFDVWSDEKNPAEFFLYEIYTGPEAFAHHLKSAHFLDFDGAVSGWVRDKSVRTWSVKS